MQPQPQYTLNPRAILVVVVLLFLLSRGGGPVVPPGPASGARWAVIVRESADQSPAMSRMILNLREGTAAKYLADKGHWLLVLDDDAVDESGRPLAIMSHIKSSIEGRPLPLLVVLEKPSALAMGKVVGVESLAADATGDTVVELLKRHGG